MKTKTTSKMRTLTSTVVIILVLGFSSCSSSQSATATNKESERTKKRDQRQAERQQLMQDLNLSPEQETQVGAILKESQEQMQAIRNGNDDRRTKFQNMRTISQETDQKLSLILNEDQMQVYEAYKARQREKMREQMGSRGRGGRRGF